VPRLVERARTGLARQFAEVRVVLLGVPAGRVALAVLAGLAALTVAGLLLLWPFGGGGEFEPTVSQSTERAEVVAVVQGGCELVVGRECRRLRVELETGPDAGRRHNVTLAQDEFTPDVDVGDEIRVQNTFGAGIDPGLKLKLPEGGVGEDVYVFVEFERRAPLALLAVGFALLVVLFGRLRGAFSLVGLVVALALVIEFVVPAMLDGEPPLAVALVGALAVMLITIPLTHGAGVKSVAAMLGAAAALLLTALLAVVFVEVVHLTGLSSEEATLLRGATGGELSPEGLLLAGMVIGALGVLDDVTVSQASTVMALRRANPAQRVRELYAGALSVGRDHLGAAVNTLVLAYAGAALPVLLVFSTQGTGFGAAINRENVAEEVVAMLVGSIGLIAAVPLTTALAALLASRLPTEALPDDAHAH
jgi:uncharacterized membrane protein